MLSVVGGFVAPRELSLNQAHAQTAKPKGDKASPPQPRASVSAAATPHIGFSPFAPPEKNDTTFVIDSAGGLDTGCSFRSDGPLVFDIPVDRYPGDINRLLSAGLTDQTAHLRLPAFDVDFFGGAEDGEPERDRISFNGHVVPTEFLTGDNNIWKLNEFDVPLQWVNFPSDPGDGGTLQSRPNTVRIDIDTANTDEFWCTSIDWASLSIKAPRPVFMAHGILSSGATWSLWSSRLGNLGVPSATENFGNLDSIENNAGKISNKIDALRRRWGVDKVNILAHSKGGLDSRQYIESHDTVANLVQIGTPNAGSPLADIAQGASLALVGIIGTAIIDSLAGGASYQLTTPYMALYNAIHGHNGDVSYVSLAGDYRYNSSIANFIVDGVMGGHSDTIVPVASVHSLPYASHLTFNSSGANVQAQHTSQTSSSGIYDQLVNILTTPVGGAQAQAQTAATVAAGLNANVAAAGVLTTSTAPRGAAIAQGETRTTTIPVDTAGSTAFTLLYGTGQLDFSVTSPGGQLINATNAGALGADVFSLGDIDGLRYQVLDVPNAQAGLWTVTVTAASVVNPAGQEPYVVSALLANSPIQFNAAADKATYHVGDTISLNATLQGGISGSAATVIAKIVRPDGGFALVPLLDDGVGDDAVAGDGRYSGHALASAPGLQRILVTADGAVARPFSRGTFVFAPVAVSTSRFSGSFTGTGVDSDGDGLFEELAVTAGVNVSNGGSYRVLGVLSDQAGNEVGTASPLAQLAAGSQSVVLHFDGKRIFQQGHDGPYVLRLVRLAEDDGPSGVALLDERTDAFTSAAYRHEQFEHADISFPGTGSDEGIDVNNNGRFEALRAHVNVNIVRPGFYDWTGRLVDRSGKELGFTHALGTLNAGLNSLDFVFDGVPIGQNRVDGPYFITDVLIFSSSASAVATNVYTTTAYQARQFEGGEVPTSLKLAGTAFAETPSTADLNLTRDWTVEMWFKDESPQGFNHDYLTLLNKGDRQVSGEAPFTVSLGFKAIQVATRSKFADSAVRYDLFAGGVDPTKWHHLAATLQADTRLLTLYLDGARVAQGRVALSAGNALPLEIGRNGAQSGKYFQGKLDDVRIWNVTRSAADIAASYQQELTGSPVGLVAEWAFNDGQGNVALDRVGSHTATLDGGASFSTEVHP